ncbi:MAG: DUF3299 domain-containing protein [Ferrimonas sp.]
MKLFIYLMLFVSSINTAYASEYREIDWPELQPEAERHLPPPMPNHGLDPFGNDPFGSDSWDPESYRQPFGEVVASLNNQKIRLPGFIVPLETDGTNVTEFLLVPYFGACIHVPPPPTNQIVYVKYPKGIPIDIVWDAVWVNGTITTNSFTIDDTSSGYTMNAALVYPYDEG